MSYVPENYSYKGIPGLRVYEVWVPIYKIPIHFYIGKTIADTSKGINATWNVDIGSNADGTAMILEEAETGDKAFIIRLSPGIRNPDNLAKTIVHECLHMSWYVLDYVGVEIDADNHEAQAYLQEDIFDSIRICVKDYLKKNKLKISV